MSDMETELIQRIRDMFPRKLERPTPEPATDLIASGVLDSLALIELLAALEHEFDIRLDLGTLEPEQFRSIESIATMVGASRAGGRAGDG